MRWLVLWSHRCRVLFPRLVQLAGTVPQSPRKSAGRPPLHSALGYGSDWNGQEVAHSNHSRDTTSRSTDQQHDASRAVRSGRVAEWTLLSLGPLRTARESF